MLRNQFLVAAATLVLLAPAVALAQPKTAADKHAAADKKAADDAAAAKKAADDAAAAKKAVDDKKAADDAAAVKKAADDKKAAEDAAVAKKAADEKKAAEEKFKNEVAELRAGKFLTSGITGGVAFAVQIPGPSDYTPAQTSVRGTVMPYVLVFPAYWRTPETTRVACASAWSAASESETDAAAFGVAQSRALRFFEAIEKTLGATPDPQTADVSDQLGLDYGSSAVNVSIVARIKAYKALADANPKKASTRDSIITWMARMEWRAGRAASCWHKRIGAWVGIPANYDANTKVNKKDAAVERTIKPVIAFGLGYSPNQYFSLLAGFTASSVTVNSTTSVNGTDVTTSLDHTIWATTIALGGNLDIASSLVK